MFQKVENGLNFWVVEDKDTPESVVKKAKTFGEADVLSIGYKYSKIMERLDGVLTRCEILIDECCVCVSSCLYAKDAKIIGKAFQGEHTPVGDVSDLEFVCYNYSEMANWARKHVNYFAEGWESPDVKDKYGHYVWYGFHYFSVRDCLRDGSDKVKFLMAFLHGKPVGVIKFGVWPLTPDHQGVAYIDVCRSMKQRGVATALVKELNKYLDGSLPLYLTAESEEGKVAGISRVFKKEIYATQCFSYEEQLAMYA